MTQDALPVSEAVVRRLRSILGDFEEYPDAISYVRTLGITSTQPPRAALGAHRISIREPSRSLGYLIWVTLHGALGFEDFGIFEKTAWEIPFRFRGARCGIAHQKFGLRMYVDREDASASEADELSQAAISQLKRAFPTVEREILEPFAVEQLDQGNVTVANHHARLRGIYEFFRERTGEAQVQVPESGVEEIRGPSGEVVGFSSWSTQPDIDKAVLANFTAAVHAYFSLLEHLLVLLLPFSGFDPSRETLSDWIGSSWREKFKRVYDVAGDLEAKRFYDLLVQCAEKYRNPYAHGAFDKKDSNLYFHVPGHAALRLRGEEGAPHLEFQWGGMENLQATWDLFDDLDRWMRGGSTRYGLQYIERGLDVPYDIDSIETFKAASCSSTEFGEFLDARVRAEDSARDMDWWGW